MLVKGAICLIPTRTYDQWRKAKALVHENIAPLQGLMKLSGATRLGMYLTLYIPIIFCTGETWEHVFVHYHQGKYILSDLLSVSFRVSGNFATQCCLTYTHIYIYMCVCVCVLCFVINFSFLTLDVWREYFSEWRDPFVCQRICIYSSVIYSVSFFHKLLYRHYLKNNQRN